MGSDVTFSCPGDTYGRYIGEDRAVAKLIDPEWEIHCEKSLFVLSSRQKIPVLRTENPAVDTRTICLPPIEFFKIPHARKATAGKSRPKITDTAGKSRPSGPWRETFYVPMPEKLRPENPSKQLQIPPENPAPSNSRNGQKIPAINYRYGRKIPASKNRYGRKILRPVTKKRPESLIINATESFSKTPPENSGGAENSAEISGTNGINFVCYMY